MSENLLGIEFYMKGTVALRSVNPNLFRRATDLYLFHKKSNHIRHSREILIKTCQSSVTGINLSCLLVKYLVRDKILYYMKNERGNVHTLISGMVKLSHTPDKSNAFFVSLVPNLINTSLSLTLISPSVFPVTLRTFSSHQVELSIRIPQLFSPKDTSPWSLKFWHELAED